jgi:hypothetical protein
MSRKRIWEYCAINRVTNLIDPDYFHITYSSPPSERRVDGQSDDDPFDTLWSALDFLGQEGWEAFHIDAAGVWYLKR